MSYVSAENFFITSQANETILNLETSNSTSTFTQTNGGDLDITNVAGNIVLNTNIDINTNCQGLQFDAGSYINLICSNGDINIESSNSGNVNLTAPNGNITISPNNTGGTTTIQSLLINTPMNVNGFSLDNVSSINSAAGMAINTSIGNIDIIAQTDDINLQSVTGMSLSVNNGALNLTTSGAEINLNTDSDITMTATTDIDMTSTTDSIILSANLDINLTATQGLINITSTNDEISLTSLGVTSITSNTGNIELIPFNNGTTELGIVRVNKNNSLLGDGFLTAGNIDINDGDLGYNITPSMTITNLNNTAGITNGVPSVSFYKNGRIVANNDKIGDFFFNANDTTSTDREWARMEVVTRNVGVGNEDGSISFFASLNGVSTEFLRINGADGDNNFLRPLDMNGSGILSTSGSLSISASSSTGTGTITLTPKPLGNLILQNLPTSSVGLPSGAIWNNLGVLNIAP